MVNIPGAVTDPSHVLAEEIHFNSGGDSIPGYLARPVGYSALAPAPYARAGGPANPNDISSVMPVMFGLPDEQVVGDLETAATRMSGTLSSPITGRAIARSLPLNCGPTSGVFRFASEIGGSWSMITLSGTYVVRRTRCSHEAC
jgi:hypothetical protein